MKEQRWLLPVFVSLCVVTALSIATLFAQDIQPVAQQGDSTTVQESDFQQSNRATNIIPAMVLEDSTTNKVIQISGRIVNEKNEPIAGVSVTVKGTNLVSTSGEGGGYKVFNIPDKGEQKIVLTFSAIGYATQNIIVATNDNNLNITLKVADQDLDEVVVIGYGTTKKSDLTGSVVSVNMDEKTRLQVTSPQDLLVGKAPGIQVTSAGGQPGQAATIRVRGGSSLSASNDPLIVVDGMPLSSTGINGMANPLSAINPDDIATFTILKDASATAIYGSRGANGVIIITTKKGGSSNVTLAYNGNVMASVLPQNRLVKVLSGSAYRTLMTQNYGPNGTSPNADIMSNLNRYPDQSTNWQNEIYQTAISTTHNLAASGTLKTSKYGGITFPYRLSGGFTGENGVLKNPTGIALRRGTFNFSAAPSFLENHIIVNINEKYMLLANTFANQAAIGSAVGFDPTKPVKAPGFDRYGGYFTWENTPGTVDPLAPVNPVALLSNKIDFSLVQRNIGNVRIDYKVHGLDGLTATVNLGSDYSISNGTTRVPPGTALSYYDGPLKATGAGYNTTYTQTNTNNLLDMYLNYRKELPSMNSRLDVTGGYSWQHYYQSSQSVQRTQNANIGVDTTYPYIPFKTEHYLVSFWGRLNYIFMNKYFLTASIRDDGSSRFAKGNQFGLFPSVALAWDINKEGFMAATRKTLSMLKFRVSYGITGQQEVGSDYPTFPNYRIATQGSYYQLGNSFYPSYTPSGYDANLRWESTTTYNVGIDYGFFNDRLSGSIDVYNRQTDNLLNTIPIPMGGNLSNTILTNVGSLYNRGVEFIVNSKIIATRDWSWDAGFNVSYNASQITKLNKIPDPTDPGVLTGTISGGNGSNIQINSVGYKPNSFYVYQQVYNSKGQPIEGLYADRNHDGKVDASDSYRDHSGIPTYILGFNTRLSYKNWDFSTSLHGNIGNYNYNNVQSNNEPLNNTHYNSFLNNRVQTATATNFQNLNLFSDYYVQNASFIRMDNITLGYNFKTPGGSKGKQFDFRVYGMVQNVFFITPYKGLDPEVFGGIDNNIYPRPRVFVLGVNATF